MNQTELWEVRLAISGRQSRQCHLYYKVVCGLSFSRSQPDFKGFLQALRIPSSSKSTPIWRVCLN